MSATKTNNVVMEKFMLILPSHMNDAIVEYAYKTGRSRAEVVREAVVEYLRNHGGRDLSGLPTTKDPKFLRSNILRNRQRIQLQQTE